MLGFRPVCNSIAGMPGSRHPCRERCQQPHIVPIVDGHVFWAEQVASGFEPVHVDQSVEYVVPKRISARGRSRVVRGRAWCRTAAPGAIIAFLIWTRRDVCSTDFQRRRVFTEPRPETDISSYGWSAFDDRRIGLG
jgi:hypothetical protein